MSSEASQGGLGACPHERQENEEGEKRREEKRRGRREVWPGFTIPDFDEIPSPHTVPLLGSTPY